MDFSIPAYLSDFSTQDDQRTIAKLKMFYVGETGDGRVFDKEFSDKLVKNGIAYLPVVAFYSDLKDYQVCLGESHNAAFKQNDLKHFNNVLTKAELLKIALMLGSDVPFFITGFDAAYGEGRGELLKEAEGVSYPIVILKKKGSLVSTKEAFKKLDERKCISSSFPSWPLKLELWKNNLVNDFDIIQPIRAEDEFKKLSSNASFDSTCGSGSCQFLVFESDKQLNNFLSLRCSYEMLITKLRKSTLH